MSKCCRDCKWWTGERSTIGKKCENPNRIFRSPIAQYKESANIACKMFEPIESSKDEATLCNEFTSKFDEIKILCIGNILHCYGIDIIQNWDFDYTDEVLRIDFTDGSFVEYYKRNLIAVEFVPKEDDR